MPRMPRPAQWSVAGQVLLMQIVVVSVTVAGGILLTLYNTRELLADEAGRAAKAVAISVADSPSVITALAGPDPSKTLQPYAERTRREAGLDFITIMSTAGIRYTHPNPGQIGKPFLGNTAPALAGHAFTEQFTGTLGLSVRAVAPVRGEDGAVRGMVSAGTTVKRIGDRFREQAGVAGLTGLLGLSVGGVGTVLVSSRLRRQTRGLDAAELTRIYEHHDAILHAVREGLLLIDAERRLTLCNDGARALLGLAAGVEGGHVSGLPLARSLIDLLTGGEERTDEIHLTGERVLVVNMAPVRSGSRRLGYVVTLRDHTELQDLAGRLDAAHGFTESLRSAAHESANRLHTVVTLIELGRTEQAVAFATAELATAQQLTDKVVGAVREPVLAALLLGKTAQADERGVELSITPDSELDDVGLDGRDLVTILGNLVDNALDAAVTGGSPARVRVTLRADAGEVLIRVADSGPGLGEREAADAFRRGWTTKADGRGLGLAMVGQAVRRLAGTIEVEREEGATFTVRLPLPEPPEETGAGPSGGRGEVEPGPSLREAGAAKGRAAGPPGEAQSPQVAVAGHGSAAEPTAGRDVGAPEGIDAAPSRGIEALPSDGPRRGQVQGEGRGRSAREDTGAAPPREAGVEPFSGPARGGGDGDIGSSEGVETGPPGGGA
ncbi:sensor histidine kinase [Sinosporangium siamense]|uniref:histidine kinase n=1 Tax=Sinosporangium siamense TaxID=1367973 RepID=A0A919RML9_9ACTN|nr:sensor histidine kinase [Sinosporangium siamense]GII95219.1 histidine kinase [Sinosporangium siamense]